MGRLWTLFTRKQTSIGSASAVLALMVLASRILGLIRDRLLSARFAPDDLGVYFAAFRLPNLLFELLVMGALTSAFIPVFMKYLSLGKEADAKRMAAIVINASVVIFIVLALPVFVWAESASRFFAPGFSFVQVQEMASYTRFIIAFQVAPLLVGNFFIGILQSYNLFLIPAIAPVVYNIGIIFGILFLTPSFGLFGTVIGVAIGAVLFVLIQIPLLLRVGYRHALSLSLRHPGVKEVGRLMAPRTFGLAASQIDTTVDLMLASLLGARMVTIFNFAQHLQQLPIGLFGATVAQAALPSLSFSSAREDAEQFKKTIVAALHQVLFFVLPVSVLFIVLRIPVVRLVFGAARFDWEATVLTGMTLSAFSVSLFAQAIIYVLARGFYALYDTRTPVLVGVVAIGINTVLSVIFIQALHLPIWSLGLSTSFASMVNAFFLLLLLDRKVARFSRWELLLPPLKMAVAALVAGVMVYVPLKLFDQLVFDTTRTFGLILLTGTSGSLGISTYFFLSWVLGVGELQSFFRLIGKVRRARTILLEPAREVINGDVQDKIS
jgi:putative peptidoglycan lipid II flippase